MKNIDKNAYHEAKYGRKSLIVISIVLLVLSVALLAGGIVLLVYGCLSNVTKEIAWKVSVGVILILLGLTGGFFGIVLLCISKSLIKVKEGSVKDGNRAIGTVNVLKCDKCGRELEEGSTFCTYCGQEVEGVVKCECGAVNKNEDEFCKNCGKKLHE